MLPVLSAVQFRSADLHLQASEPISSSDLMERAAGRCVQRILELQREGHFGPVAETSFLILAGMGNNGGDGLVIARLLHAAGLKVRVIRAEYKSEASNDNALNWKRLVDLKVNCLSTTTEEPGLGIGSNEVIIDALFGIGLSGAVPVQVANIIEQARDSERPVIAIDLPSGLFADDNSGVEPNGVMRASLTLTFEFPKLCMLFPENDRYVGAWEVIPIGLDHEHCIALGPTAFMLQETDVVQLLRPRPHFGHKGTFGHALLIAGSVGRYGAAVLSTRAALRSGAGLVTSHVPKGALHILQTTCPEAMCSLSVDASYVDSMPDLSKASAIGIGPGLGSESGTSLVIKRIVQECSAPMVFDADALNILAEHRTWIAFLPPGSILTPHPKEFDRLLGTTFKSGQDRCLAAQAFAQRHGVILILKGAWTAICPPSGPVLFNSTGNPGMAKGGSGDALTGLLTGLLAQGYGALQAAMLGVYLHGMAGDMAAQHKSMDGMHAGDIIDALPEAWQNLRNAHSDGPRLGL